MNDDITFEDGNQFEIIDGPSSISKTDSKEMLEQTHDIFGTNSSLVKSKMTDTKTNNYMNILDELKSIDSPPKSY